jgi:hypothetical protein
MDVIWRGNVVGQLNDAVPEMWYLEGSWQPLPTEPAKEFEQRARGLDAKAVMVNPSQGLRILLADHEEDLAQQTLCIVFSLHDGRLFVRRVFAEKAIRWARENVPE